MNIENVKKMSLSQLSLIIQSKRYLDSLRKEAEDELKKRMRDLTWNLDDFLDTEYYTLEKRGYNISSYLIATNVTSQQLIETYFLYKWNASETVSHDNLLFSEKHLCNDLDYGLPFFTEFCKQEIQNINKRQNTSSSYNEIARMVLVRKALETRNEKLKKMQKANVKQNDAVNYFERFWNDPIFFGSNLTEEELKRMRHHFPENIKLAYMNMLNAKLIYLQLENPQKYYDKQFDYVFQFVKKDAKKLWHQQNKLKTEMKKSNGIDYNTNNMKRIENILRRTK